MSLCLLECSQEEKEEKDGDVSESITFMLFDPSCCFRTHYVKGECSNSDEQNNEHDSENWSEYDEFSSKRLSIGLEYIEFRRSTSIMITVIVTVELVSSSRLSSIAELWNEEGELECKSYRELNGMEREIWSTNLVAPSQLNGFIGVLISHYHDKERIRAINWKKGCGE